MDPQYARPNDIGHQESEILFDPVLGGERSRLGDEYKQLTSNCALMDWTFVS